tara:strand:+ start:11861 stop:12400 length:540 start_codon:yes stop_codon:yes gene_type:complete
MKMETLSKYLTIFLVFVSVIYFFNPDQIFSDTRPTTNIAFVILAIGSGLLWLERGNTTKSFLTDSFRLEDKYLEHGFIVNENGSTIYWTDQKGELVQAFDPFDPQSYTDQQMENIDGHDSDAENNQEWGVDISNSKSVSELVERGTERRRERLKAYQSINRRQRPYGRRENDNPNRSVW